MAVPQNRFTDRARAVLSFAKHSAQQSNLHAVTPGRILVGLAEGDRGVARMILERLGVDLPLLIDEIPTAESLPAEGECQPQPRLNDACQEMLEYGHEEGQLLGLHGYMGTEHLLLGILHLTDDPAACFLRSRGVTIDSARTAVCLILNMKPPT